MVNKKIIFGIFLISLLGGCATPTAMLGPAYTLNSSGSVLQAGFSYGSNQLITAYTGKTPIENLFINCGWGTGGFKATPGSAHVFAETVAKGEPNKIAAPFSIERHFSGALVDEAAAAAVAH